MFVLIQEKDNVLYAVRDDTIAMYSCMVSMNDFITFFCCVA